MQYSSKGLPHLIPAIILTAPSSSEIILVSPWMENILLYPPPIGGRDYKVRTKTIHLGELLNYAIAKNRNRVTLIVREVDWRIQQITKDIPESSSISLHSVDYLHAKLLITDSRVIQTSANFTRTSLYRNVESCSILNNQHHSAKAYLQLEVGIYI